MAGYGSDEGFETWLEENGYELPSTAPDLAVLRNRASSYIDALYGSRFAGYPTGGILQGLAYPRQEAMVFGSYIASDIIPAQVITATYEAALVEAQNPDVLKAVVVSSQVVKREKIGPIETEYAVDNSNALRSATVLLSSVEGLLTPLFMIETPGFMLRAIG